jgi:predicted nucleic acid-binding Zn ribbon protein
VSLKAILEEIFSKMFSKDEIRFNLPMAVYCSFFALFFALSFYTSYYGMKWYFDAKNNKGVKVLESELLEKKSDSVSAYYDNEINKMIKEKEIFFDGVKIMLDGKYTIPHKSQGALSKMQESIERKRTEKENAIIESKISGAKSVLNAEKKMKVNSQMLTFLGLFFEFLKVFLSVIHFSFVYYSMKDFDSKNDNALFWEIVESENVNTFEGGGNVNDNVLASLKKGKNVNVNTSKRIGFTLANNEERKCIVCGADISGKRSHAKTCSNSCRIAYSVYNNKFK